MCNTTRRRRLLVAKATKQTYNMKVDVQMFKTSLVGMVPFNMFSLSPHKVRKQLDMINACGARKKATGRRIVQNF
jgi:hypothetical protein